MPTKNKELIIARTRKELGPIYERIKKISSSEIKKSTVIREQFFEFFKNNGIQFALNNPSKPYLNDISPGCWTCVNGTRSSIYMNQLCTRDCFFCLKDKKNKKEMLPLSEGFEFEHLGEYINFLRRFEFEGISFAGGEPFLVFEKIIEYIKEIQEIFKSKYYIWIYTNGDLVTRENLRLLRDVGLNELRFNLSARHYDLEPLELAAKYIDTITVEIPAIPEDLELLKSSLKKFEQIKVKYLILHQLLLNKFNYPEFIQRDYTLIHSASFYYDILESEFAAFDFLKYSVEMKTKIGVSYCASCYKQRFQTRAFRNRTSQFCKDEFDSITKTGYLRKFQIKCSLSELGSIINFLKEQKIPFQIIEESRNRDNRYKIPFLPKNLESLSEYINNIAHNVQIIYSECFKKQFYFDGAKNAKYSEKYRLGKITVDEISLDRNIKFFLLQKIIENNDLNTILDELTNWKGTKDSFEMNEIINFYKELEYLEYIPTNLPDYL